jgi:hypothetical protein
MLTVKRLRRIAWNGLMTGSALLIVGAVGLWVASYRWHPAFRFHGLSGLSWFSSADGRIKIVGPPDEGRDDPAVASVAALMSNHDFQWSAPLDHRGARVVRGEPRKGSPTDRMFDRVQAQRVRRQPLSPEIRLWLRAMERRDSFVPAHMLLSFAALHWHDANVWPDSGRPYLYMPADASGTGPDLSAWQGLGESWHRELDETLYDWSYGWLVAIALIFPLIRLTRPRRVVAQSPIVQRWIFNGASLASLIACFALAAIWWRSYRTVHEWQLSRQPVGTFVAPGSMPYNGAWVRYRWFGYSDGRMQLLERTVYEPDVGAHEDYRNNYWIIGSPSDAQAYRRYVFTAAGSWFKSSINYFSLPPQAVPSAQPPPMPSFIGQVPLPIPVPVIPLASVGIPGTVPTKMVPKVDPLLLELQAEMQKSAAAIKAENDAFTASPRDTGGAQVARWELTAHLQRIVQLRLAISDLIRPMPNSIPVVSPLPKVGSGARTIVMSFWVIVLPTMILPLLWIFLSTRRGVRRLRDQCPICGYDLRATPERCPECGTVHKGAAE